jgi:flagellar biosynthesis/type III secretory pathway protein FliH
MTAQNQHSSFERCRDRACERYACRAWREGYEDARADFYQPRYDEGYSDGQAAGYREGERAGYDRGFADGVASARKS